MNEKEAKARKIRQRWAQMVIKCPFWKSWDGGTTIKCEKLCHGKRSSVTLHRFADDSAASEWIAKVCTKTPPDCLHYKALFDWYEEQEDDRGGKDSLRP